MHELNHLDLSVNDNTDYHSKHRTSQASPRSGLGPDKQPYGEKRPTWMLRGRSGLNCYGLISCCFEGFYSWAKLSCVPFLPFTCNSIIELPIQSDTLCFLYMADWHIDVHISRLRMRQSGRYFAYNIPKYSLHEKCCILFIFQYNVLPVAYLAICSYRNQLWSSLFMQICVRPPWWTSQFDC